MEERERGKTERGKNDEKESIGDKEGKHIRCESDSRDRALVSFKCIPTSGRNQIINENGLFRVSLYMVRG